jgi:hypothetical protein
VINLAEFYGFGDSQPGELLQWLLRVEKLRHDFSGTKAKSGEICSKNGTCSLYTFIAHILNGWSE